jgi:Raf kinase inhibitor-like YbhB/YbcL family protein
MHDPDATNQKIWYHWIMINIPATISGLAKGEQIDAPALECRTSFGISSYGGPCPPVGHGKHRYIFTVYALDVAEISAKPELAPEQIEKLITPHILDKASITAFYERK